MGVVRSGRLSLCVSSDDGSGVRFHGHRGPCGQKTILGPDRSYSIGPKKMIISLIAPEPSKQNAAECASGYELRKKKPELDGKGPYLI